MPLIRKTILGDEVKLFVLPPGRQFVANREEGRKRAHFNTRWKQFCASDGVFGLDVETTAIDEDQSTFAPDMKLRAVQFGTQTEGWLLDPANPWWRRRIVALLNDPTKRFVSHTNYDILWVLREFEINLGVGDRSIDTLPLAALVRPGNQPKDLKTLSSLFIDDQLREAEIAMNARFRELAPKGHRVGKRLKAWGFTNIPLDDPSFGLYGALDAVYVRRLLPVLNELVRGAQMARLSKREQRIRRICTDMQVRGIRLDPKYTKVRLDEANEFYESAYNRIVATTGIKPGSNKLGPWLEGHEVRIYERTPTGNPKLDKETVADLVQGADPSSPGYEVLCDLAIVSEWKNLRSNLAISYRARDADDIVHPNYNTQQAVTGRMSITRPAMQTFKKGPLRGCWIAREGKVLVGGDYKGQETRLAAAFSDDPNYLRIVRENLNMHEMTAKLIFPYFVDKLAHPREYAIAKVLDFAQQYGAGPRKIAAQLGIGLPEAKELWLAWRKAYRGLVKWSDELSHYDSITNPWGRMIPRDRWRPYTNGNYAIQSSGRDILGVAMIKIEKMGWRDNLWLPVHDEIILEVPEDRAQEAVGVLSEAMFTTVGDIDLEVDAAVIGKRWWSDAE